MDEGVEPDDKESGTHQPKYQRTDGGCAVGLFNSFCCILFPMVMYLGIGPICAKLRRFKKPSLQAVVRGLASVRQHTNSLRNDQRCSATLLSCRWHYSQGTGPQGKAATLRSSRTKQWRQTFSQHLLHRPEGAFSSRATVAIYQNRALGDLDGVAQHCFSRDTPENLLREQLNLEMLLPPLYGEPR